MTDSTQNLSPLQALLDAVGAVIQEAKHHGRDPWARCPLPKTLINKLLLLEKASGPEVITEMKRDAERFVKALDLINECKRGITELGLDTNEVLMILNRAKDI